MYRNVKCGYRHGYEHEHRLGMGIWTWAWIVDHGFGTWIRNMDIRMGTMGMDEIWIWDLDMGSGCGIRDGRHVKTKRYAIEAMRHKYHDMR